jgi:hypothetical protein
MKTYITALKPIFVLALLALPAFAAFPNGYSYCKVVTTSATMVSGTSDLINYPLTVILTDADLKTTTNGGLVNNANGYDIGFYPDCSGSGTALQWEMESYSPTTGAIVAHLLRPTLSHTTNDTIGMYYGGSFATFQSSASAVWDANYKGVWHLSNVPTSATDSTTNARAATTLTATPATGEVAGAAAFDGTTSHKLYYANSSDLNFTSQNFTAEFWVKPAALSVAPVGQGQWKTSGWYVYLESNGAISLNLNAGGVDNQLISTIGILTGVWQHVAVVRTGTNTGAIYLNGSATGIAANTLANAASDPTDSYGIGSGYGDGTTNITSGAVDEVRISNSVRSADWILTEYRNQSAPGTYLSTGPRIIGAAHVRHIVIGGI